MEPNSHNVELEELRDRISWLIRLRWVAVLGVLVTIWVSRRFLGVHLEVTPLFAIAIALAGYNVVFWIVGKWVPVATSEAGVSYFANFQIALDLLALTGFIHFSGGIENPFICYYVFHIVIASILLSRVATYLQVTFAIALLVGLALFEATGVIRHYHLRGFIPTELYQIRTYMFGVLFAIGTMLYFTAFMATSITSRLRRREAEIVRLSDALRKHAEDLSGTYEALRQLEGVRSDYLHRVAHHIRSPLATVERMLAVVAEGRTGQLSSRALEMLERARLRVRDLLSLARDLLVLSRTREAPPLGEREVVDLVTIIRDAEADFREQASQASVALTADCPEYPVEVTGDPETLKELLDNLVSNAIKYTPVGGEVRITLEQKVNLAELSVSDSGIGIPKDEQDQVFEEFYRAANARELGKEGTGLGLSIVKAIVETFDGRLSCESEEGGGTCFRVALPCQVGRSRRERAPWGI